MAATKICTTCGYIGRSKRVTKGSILIELLLWLAFLIPGLIYSLWRITSRYDACPKCGSPNMIPTDSPVGRRLLEEQRQSQITQHRPPSITPHDPNV
jgi:hypothetical protein